MKKRIGIVGEGPTDYLVLKSMIDKITDEENDYLRIQPEPNALGQYGNGWKGVWNWCEATGPYFDKIMQGIVPKIDMIVIQMCDKEMNGIFRKTSMTIELNAMKQIEQPKQNKQAPQQ